MKIDPEIDYAQRHFPPETWRIAGARLLPFRLGHQLILQAKGSPFLCSSVEFTPRDLVFALWVCSRPYKKAKRFRMSLLWRIWSFRLLWKFKRDDDAFWERIEMFFNYLGEEHEKPKRIRKVGRDGQERQEATISPSLMCFKRELLSRYRNEDDLWELPMRVAVIDCYGIAEANGAIKWPTVSEGRQ